MIEVIFEQKVSCINCLPKQRSCQQNARTCLLSWVAFVWETLLLGVEGSKRVQLCGTKGGCGAAKKIACVFERSDWMFFSLFWPMRFARARTM